MKVKSTLDTSKSFKSCVWQKKGSFIFWVYVEIVTKAVVGPTENFISRL